jgi:hypothetical protein
MNITYCDSKWIAVLFEVTFNAMPIQNVMGILVTFMTENFTPGGEELFNQRWCWWSKECARAYGSGSQCRPIECIFGTGKPWGVGIFGRGVYEPGEGNGEVSLRATWERGGWILSLLGGFQVSREGEKGEQKGISKGEKKLEECAVYI